MLATHQIVQEKLHEEIISAFDGKAVRVRFGMLKRMPFLDAVVFETLRLFPPVPIEMKQAARDTKLPNGVGVEKGTVVTFEP